MHSVQAAPRQRHRRPTPGQGWPRCTPCRQRRGKGTCSNPRDRLLWMHPVQAAPRQSFKVQRGQSSRERMHPVQAAPRQRLCGPCWGNRPSSMHPVQAAPRQRLSRIKPSSQHGDAPRAGSAEAKRHGQSPGYPPGMMHPVQAAQSKITTCRPMVL